MQRYDLSLFVSPTDPRSGPSVRKGSDRGQVGRKEGRKSSSPMAYRIGIIGTDMTSEVVVVVSW